MIITRAPMRISFVGGGTDLPDFYKKTPGRVISTAIDKFVYIAINKTPLVKKVSARYSVTETVSHSKDLQHTRIRAALTDLGIASGVEIGSFAPLPVKTGLGSSSSFSVALLRGLYTYLDKKIDKKDIAEAACRLEIELVGEPIGKQDQYAAALGGFNTFQFNPDGTVDAEPVLLDYRKKAALENHILLFFTGLTRPAASILSEQKANTEDRRATLTAMADSVFDFRERLLGGDFKGLGDMLHDGWLKKKSLASTVSNSIIDEFYNAGMNAGAWGGKVLGAGGGGCVMFLAPLENKEAVRKAVAEVAKNSNQEDFCEIPVKFAQTGAETLFNSNHHTSYFIS